MQVFDLRFLSAHNSGMNTRRIETREADSHSRSPGSIKPGLCLLAIAFVALFHASLWPGKVMVPGDLLYFYEPWRTEFSFSSRGPSNWILFDEILEFYPWRHVMRNALSEGRIPLWDPTAFCGYPFIGTFQTAFLYLPDRLSDPLPFRFYPLFRAFFHIFAAGIGTGIYLRRRSFSTPAITLGTVGFALNGFMLVWLGHPHIKVAAWLPWLFHAVDHLVMRPRKGRLMLAVVSAMALTAGHIETALHVFTAAVLYWLVTSLGMRRRAGHLLGDIRYAAPAVAGAVLFSAAMVLPFAEYLVRSVAFATRAGGVVTEPFLDRILAFAQLMPRIYGSSATGDYWYRGFNSAEVNGGFAGVVVIALALTAVFRLRDKVFRRAHTVLAITCFGVAYGVPVISDIALHIPGFKMSYNFRMTLPLAFSLVILAAAMLNDIVIFRSVPKRTFYTVAAVLAGTIMSVFFWVERIPAAPGYHRTSPVTPVVHALLPLGGAVLLLWLFASGFISRKRLGYLTALAVAAELVGFGYGFNPACPVSALERTPAAVSALRVENDTDHPFRTLMLGYLFPPHLSAVYAIHDVRGNDALTPLLEEDVIALAEPSVRAPGKLPALRMMWLNSWRSPIRNLLNVEKFAYPLSNTSPKGIPSTCRVMGGTVICPNPDALPRVFTADRWKRLPDETHVLAHMASPEFDPRHVVFSSARTAPRCPSSPGSSQCRIRRYRAGDVYADTRCTHPSLLVLSETYFPGWKAYVDDSPQPTLPVDHMLIGVFLDPGQHTVRFRYEPVSFLLGSFLTLTALAALTAALTAARRRNTLPR